MTLLENYLSSFYPDYHTYTKHILFREALDVLIYGYYGCLEKFEQQYLKPFAGIVHVLYEHHVGTQVGLQLSFCLEYNFCGQFEVIF